MVVYFKHNNFKSFKIISNQNGILGGIELARCVFRLVDNKIKFIDIQKKLFLLIKRQEFSKYKKISPKNIKDIIDP